MVKEITSNKSDREVKRPIPSPPANSLAGFLMGIPNIGIVFALAVMGSWICVLLYCLFKHELSIETTPFLLLLVAHLDTGLFITAHDSIHGTVSKDFPLINRWLGKFCLLVFAGFDYDLIRDEHWRHHSHAGL